MGGDEQELLVESQCELAAKLAHLVLAMVAARLARGLWLLVGWPHQLLRCLSPSVDSVGVLAEFREDVDVFRGMVALGREHRSGVGPWLERSPMHLPYVIQCARALHRRSWTIDPSFVAFLRRKSQRFTNSVICEDGFNIGKNSGRIKGERRYMRPAKFLTTVIAKSLTTKLHRYRGVSRACAPSVRGSTVKDGVFTAKSAECSLKLDGLCSARSKPSWCSPGAERLLVEWADLALGRAVMEQGANAARLDLVSNAWLGAVFAFDHNILVCKADSQQWLLPLCHFAGS